MSRPRDTEMTPTVTGEALLPIRGHDGRRAICPECGENLSRTALVRIAYTYEPCDCPAASYVHLVERLWHREHLR